MRNRWPHFVQRYHALSACAGWTGLALLFYDITAGKQGTQLTTSIIHYFSYFTILSNILVALIFTLSWLAPESHPARLLNRPAVRAGAAIYITVTAVVYILILSNLGNRTFAPLAGTILLHYVVPALYVFDWLFFCEKGGLNPADILYWLAFPFIYAVYTMIHGAASGFYPYGFMTVPKLGYPHVLLNCLFLLVSFLALGVLAVGLDRSLASRKASLDPARKGSDVEPCDGMETR